MQVAAGLTIHTVMLVVEKRERAVATQAMLAKFGMKVIVATTMYEALKLMGQEMPHLVVSEVTLTDGTAVALFDKLAQDPLLKVIPILAHSFKKSTEEIALIKCRKFAGAYAGAVEPKLFVSKVLECLKNYSLISPFYFGAEQCGIVPDLVLKVDSTVIGKVGDQVLLRSGSEIDPNASMLCIPKTGGLDPVVLRMASNIKYGEEVFNLFPLSRVVGKGRCWLEKLSIYNIENGTLISQEEATKQSANTSATPKKVIFYDPSESRFIGFRDVLKGYNFELIYAKTLSVAVAILTKDVEAISGVYMHEMINDGASTEWKAAYSKIPANVRPPIICGTTASSSKSSDSMRYIKRPFGMGVLVEVMESMFLKAAKVAAVASKQGSSSVTGTSVALQAPGKIIGLDETGGVMQLKFPVAKGSRVEIVHPEISTLLGVQQVAIISVAELANEPNSIQVRFESISAGMSKAKYWEKISKVLQDKASAVGQSVTTKKPAA